MARHSPEHDECVAIIRMIRLHTSTYPPLAWFFHIDSGRATRAQGARKKAEGVIPGIPDYCLPYASSGFHGLYLEMKAPGKKPTKQQKKAMAYLQGAGYAVAWFDDWREAWTYIIDYLDGRL